MASLQAALNEIGVSNTGAFASFLRDLQNGAVPAAKTFLQSVRAVNPNFSSTSMGGAFVFAGSALSVVKSAGTKIRVFISFTADYPSPNAGPCTFQIYIDGSPAGELLQIGVDASGRISGGIVWETNATGAGTSTYDLVALTGAVQTLHIGAGNAIMIVDEVA